MTKNTFCLKTFCFSINHGLTEYSEFLLLFELLFCEIRREDPCNESLIITRLLDTALTSYQNFYSDYDPPENPTHFEFKAIKSIVIEKSDKVTTFVILDKCCYKIGIEKNFNDKYKLFKLNISVC